MTDRTEIPELTDDEAQALLEELAPLAEEVPPMPEGTHEGWMRAIEEERPSMEETSRKTNPGRWVSILGIAAALIFVVAGTLLTRDSLNARTPALAAKSAAVSQAARLDDSEAEADYAVEEEEPMEAPAAAFEETAAFGLYTGTAPTMAFAANDAAFDEDAGMPEPEVAFEAAPEAEAMAADTVVFAMAAEAPAAEEEALPAATAMPTPAAALKAAAPAATPVPSPTERPRKLVRDVSLTVTAADYDSACAAVEQLCAEAGGWISWSAQSEDSRGLRSASYTLRIPADRLDSALDRAAALGRVTWRNENVTDVTENYYDLADRLATQRALLARLQALVPQASSLPELVDLEERIEEVQTTVEHLQTSLNRTDTQVNYATVSLSLRENRPEEAVTDTGLGLGDRVRSALHTGFDAFVGFLGDAAVFLTAALPFLALAGVLVLVFHLVHRRRRKDV